MLTIYEKNHIFLVVFLWFARLLWRRKNSFFLFLLTFALLILDSSPEATTRGFLHEKLLSEILQYLQKNIFVRLLRSAERRIIFVPRLFKFSDVLVIL